MHLRREGHVGLLVFGRRCPARRYKPSVERSQRVGMRSPLLEFARMQYPTRVGPSRRHAGRWTQRHGATTTQRRKPRTHNGDLPSSSRLALALQIRIPARLHPLRLARHLRGATVLPIMLSCVFPACEHQPCDRLSGEFSSVSSGPADIRGSRHHHCPPPRLRTQPCAYHGQTLWGLSHPQTDAPAFVATAQVGVRRRRE